MTIGLDWRPAIVLQFLALLLIVSDTHPAQLYRLALTMQVLMSAAPSRVNRDSRTSELEDDLVVRTPPEASGKVGSVAGV